MTTFRENSGNPQFHFERHRFTAAINKAILRLRHLCARGVCILGHTTCVHTCLDTRYYTNIQLHEIFVCDYN